MKSTPYEHLKAFLEEAFVDVGTLTEETFLRCCDEQFKTVRNESARIGILLSLDKKEVIKAEGAGLDLIGYRASELQWFSIMKCVPGLYDWFLTLYLISALDHICKKSLAHLENKCLFSITVPMSDRNKSKFYRAHFRAWVVEHEKPGKPVVIQIIIDLSERWCYPSDPPIRSIGELSSPTFSMDEINKEMKNFVSRIILLEPKYLGLQAIEMWVIQRLLQGYTPEKIAKEMKTKKHNVDAHKRKIKKMCNKNLGFLPDAKQWAHFLHQMFDFDVLK